MESPFVDRMVRNGTWRLEDVPAEVVGLKRRIQVYRAVRRTDLITYSIHGDKNTFCPPLWWDLGIGSGPCGLGCRACFLMLTFRCMRDPLFHVVYENIEDFWVAVRAWLAAPNAATSTRWAWD